MRRFRQMAEHKPLFDLIAACGAHTNFTLAGLAGTMPDGTRADVYVHGKLMLVDDVFATVELDQLRRKTLDSGPDRDERQLSGCGRGRELALRPVRRASRAGYVGDRCRRSNAAVLLKGGARERCTATGEQC